MAYTYYDEVHSLQGRKIADDKARKRLDTAEENIDITSEINRQAKQNNAYLLNLLIDLQKEYDTTGKLTQVNSDASKMEHESSLMKIGEEIGVYFVLNTVDTTDSSAANHNAKGYIWLKDTGELLDLTEATGVYFATGRVQHGLETDVIIATDENGVAYIVKYENKTWTATAFTNNSGVTLDGCNSQMLYKDGKFYHVVCKGTTKVFPIVTFDMETMTIEKVSSNISLPLTFSGIYEASLYEFNSKIYVALRPSYTSLRRGYLGLALLGIVENMEVLPEVKEYIMLPDGSSRVLLFDYNSRLFCITTGFNRVNGRLFDVTNIHAYEPIAQLLYNVNYPDVLLDGSTMHYCATDKKNTEAGCKVVYGTFPYIDLLK